MKSNHYFKRLFLILIAIFFVNSAYAKEDIEDKVKNLTLELRCMTCQNQSVYDSDAEFSNDIKKIVRKQFYEGKSSMEIKIFLKERYGEYILFKPLFDYKNLFLWIFPFIMLIIGLFFIIFKVRRNI
tara:strand:- start:52 stop:432 length:381 start_codon:yes stop_codon:yes gene_type:complete